MLDISSPDKVSAPRIRCSGDRWRFSQSQENYFQTERDTSENKVLLLLSIALVGGCRRVRCSGSDKAVEDFPTAHDHPPPLRVQHTHGHQSEEPQHFTKVAVQPAPHQQNLSHIWFSKPKQCSQLVMGSTGSSGLRARGESTAPDIPARIICPSLPPGPIPLNRAGLEARPGTEESPREIVFF